MAKALPAIIDLDESDDDVITKRAKVCLADSHEQSNVKDVLWWDVSGMGQPPPPPPQQNQKIRVYEWTQWELGW